MAPSPANLEEEEGAERAGELRGEDGDEEEWPAVCVVAVARRDGLREAGVEEALGERHRRVDPRAEGRRDEVAGEEDGGGAQWPALGDGELLLALLLAGLLDVGGMSGCCCCCCCWCWTAASGAAAAFAM